MTLSNAVGFFSTGFGMELLPRVMAAGFSVDQALWLAVMGVVMMAIGGAHLVGMGWKTLPMARIRAAARALVLADEVDAPAGVKAEAKTSVRG